MSVYALTMDSRDACVDSSRADTIAARQAESALQTAAEGSKDVAMIAILLTTFVAIGYLALLADAAVVLRNTGRTAVKLDLTKEDIGIRLNSRCPVVEDVQRHEEGSTQQ